MPAEVTTNKEIYLSQSAFYATIGGYFQVTAIKAVKDIYPGIAWEKNSGNSTNAYIDEGEFTFNNNRQFIKLKQSFEQQLEHFKDVFYGQKKYILLEKMQCSAEPILNYLPDRISLQLTPEGSIFYTFLKDGFTIYLQHFLLQNHEDLDEAMLSVFKGEQNILNFAGSLSATIIAFSNALFPESSLMSEFA